MSAPKTPPHAVAEVLLAEPTCTVQLTSRELTLIRVACLQRLHPLAKLALGSSHAAKSYDDTRELLNGKLWTARKQLPSKPTGESE